MDNVFINEAFDNSIKDYLNSKKLNEEIANNSFTLIALKMLACIYGEIDIINPYILKNEKAFKQNIIKFGYSDDEYAHFKRDFTEFYKIEQLNKNMICKKVDPLFRKILKHLIDMYCEKKFNYKVAEAEEMEFFDLIYKSGISDNDIEEINNYFHAKKEQHKEEIAIPKKTNVLNIEAYEILNYSLTDIANMDAVSVEKINENVYNFFAVDVNAENKNDLLNEAIENYKRANSRLSTGNGYVDILLIMGIVVTGILLLTIATFVIL